jgi:hypothetical protein
MGTLLFAAFAWDCVRLANDARRRVEIADEEVLKQERRLTTLLNSSPQRTPEVDNALRAHETAIDGTSRQAAYNELIAAFRQTMSQRIDPTNPLDRKFADEAAGAINRRDIALKAYEDEAAVYQQYIAGLRGAIASWFTSPASPKTAEP